MNVFLGFFIVAGLAAITGFFLRRRQLQRWIYGMAVLVHAGGALLTVSQKNDLSHAFAERQWPSVIGIVDTSFIGGIRAFHPLIRYSYNVNNQEYFMETNLGTPGFGGRKSRQQTARNIISAYPPGKKLKVYYNPDSPQESKLTRAIPWNLFMRVGLGYLLFGLGLTFLFSKTFFYLFNGRKSFVK